MGKELKCEIFNDSMQNFRRYGIPHAQLIIADVPYNCGTSFYGSNPEWYRGGDNKNGESDKAGKAAFYSDFNFNLYEFMHFGSKMLKKEPKKGGERGKSSDAPCMIVFCSLQQIPIMIEAAKKHGFNNYLPLVFCKGSSSQALKANMRICGAVEFALVLYKSYLPKFRNVDSDGNNHMILNWHYGGEEEEWGNNNGNWLMWQTDGKDIPKRIHPTQKPVSVLKWLIEIFTDPGDVVIDPCCGSGSTGRACIELERNFYGFEISKLFYKEAKKKMLNVNYMDEQKQIAGQMSLFDLPEAQ